MRFFFLALVVESMSLSRFSNQPPPPPSTSTSEDSHVEHVRDDHVAEEDLRHRSRPEGRLAHQVSQHLEDPPRGHGVQQQEQQEQEVAQVVEVVDQQQELVPPQLARVVQAEQLGRGREGAIVAGNVTVTADVGTRVTCGNTTGNNVRRYQGNLRQYHGNISVVCQKILALM